MAIQSKRPTRGTKAHLVWTVLDAQRKIDASLKSSEVYEICCEGMNIPRETVKSNIRRYRRYYGLNYDDERKNS